MSPGADDLRPPPGRCVLCGGTAFRPTAVQTSENLRALGAFRVWRCAGCGAGATLPVPPDGDTRAIAPDLPPHDGPTLASRLLARFVRQRTHRAQAALGRPLPGTRWLDVGAGACAFANALHVRGAHVTALELNPDNRPRAHVGVRFLDRPFDERALADAGLGAGTFDGISMWHVLEHLPDPAQALRLARHLLAPQGVLLLSVPNLDALQARVGGTQWCYHDVPRHRTHFTRGALDRALRQAALRPVRRWRWSEEYEPFGAWQTLLNVLSDSHNVFYDRAKKGQAPAPRHPGRVALVHALGLPLLAPAALLALAGALVDRPATLDVAARAA